MKVNAPLGMKLVAPDGGYGWLIVLGSSLIHLSTRSMEPSFGLLFGVLLKQLRVETTGAAVIMSTLDAMINFSGLFVGPLIKKFSYRRIGLLGAFMSATALFLTSFAASMFHIIITYSIIGGIGFGLATASSMVAINSYFNHRKGQAVGLAMTGTGLGFMAMPQAISLLMEEYDFRSTVLILSAIVLNAAVGASLLQPVQWHMKLVPIETPDKDKDTLAIQDTGSEEIKIIYNHEYSDEQINMNNNNKPLVIQEKKGRKGCCQKVAALMDLNLFKDLIFLNILFGLSVAHVAELNFKMVVPFFMTSLGYTKQETATALSVMAISDIIARVVMPPLCDRLPYTRRTTYAVGCFFVALARSVLAEQKEWTPLIIMFIIHGFFRGVTLINFHLVISEYASVDKFAPALGLTMVTRGIFVCAFGPFNGWIRDYTNSYPICIHMQSTMVLICVFVWSTEFLVRHCCQNSTKKPVGDDLT